MVAKVAQAAAPDPVAGDRIDQKADHCAVDTIGYEFSPLCHGSRNDGSRCGTEDSLKYDESFKWNAVRRRIAVRIADKKVDASKDAAGTAEHDAKSQKPEDDGPDTEVHQIFHNNVSGIFCPRESGFHHGEAGLHEKDQNRTN